MFNLKAEVASLTKGRLRVRCPQLHTRYGHSISTHLLEVPGVKEVTVNPKSGSMLVQFDPAGIDYAKFNSTFNQLIEKEVKRNIQEAAHPTVHKKPAHQESKSLKQRFLSQKTQKKMRVFENRNMVVGGAVCLAGIALRRYGLHSLGGWWLTAAALAHTWRYRKTVW